jgi:hypothetical protein
VLVKKKLSSSDATEECSDKALVCDIFALDDDEEEAAFFCGNSVVVLEAICRGVSALPTVAASVGVAFAAAATTLLSTYAGTALAEEAAATELFPAAIMLLLNVFALSANHVIATWK